MFQDLDALIAHLDTIATSTDVAVLAHQAEINAVAPRHRRGAANLVRYTALRQHDLRGLQSSLLDLGATSLATTEADVQAKVHAARTVLAALRGDPGPWDLAANDQALLDGDDILEANAKALFGVQRPGRPTRIMVTMPAQAANDYELVAGFVEAGMDVARVNCAHDGPLAWEQIIGHVRKAAATAGRNVLIAMDVAGPKLRTGPIIDGPAVGHARVASDDTGRLIAPSALWLVPSDVSDAAAAPVVPGGRGTVVLRVDRSWLTRRRQGDKVHLQDNRGRQRTFGVTRASDDGVLVEGKRAAYIAEGSALECGADTTTASGVPPLPRRLSLAAGDQLVLSSEMTPVELPAAGRVARIGCTLPDAVAALEPGQPVLFDDGAIAATVESISSGEATLRITRTKPGGQRLGAEKGINLPETVLPLPALTEEDQSHLAFIAEHADLLDVSFIRSVADVDHITRALDDIGADSLGVVFKIETAQGFRELPSILLAAMRRERIGVMIARGDMAVEIGFERLSEVPRQILTLCESAHVPAIWATQVLDTMSQTGQPTRAEITDAAAAQRSDCVMLNKGPHIIEAIAELDDILHRMGEVQRKSRTLMRHIHSWDGQ